MVLLNTEKLAWKELIATRETSGPMKKAHCGLLAFDGQVLAFGGVGKAEPINPSPLAQYEKYHDWTKHDWIYTNEHHLLDQKRGERHFKYYGIEMLIS